MSEQSAVRAENVLPDDADYAVFDGVEVRKGSIAAFIANAKTLESLSSTDPRYLEVEAQLRELIPAVRAVGLFDVLQPRTQTIAALVDDRP